MKTLNQTPTAPAQAQHSPLPWTYFVGNANGRGLIRIEQEGTGVHVASMPRGAVSEANADYIVRACNNAQRLADALANLARPLTQGWKVSDMDVRIREANEALAEWNKSV
jgi:hypothetical protein